MLSPQQSINRDIGKKTTTTKYFDFVEFSDSERELDRSREPNKIRRIFVIGKPVILLGFFYRNY